MAEIPPGSGIPIIGPILTALDGIFGSAADVQVLAAQTDNVEKNAWSNVLSMAQSFWGELQSIGNILKSIGLAIGLALYHLWEDFLKPIIDEIIKALEKLHDKLNKILKPIQKILKRIIGWYQKYILRWELLAIQIISIVRTWLTILRLLHVKWAAKLDADLAKIQGYITSTITPVVSTLNQISSILGLAIDPGGFIKAPFMSASIFNSVADVKRAANFDSARPIYASEAQQAQDQKAIVSGAVPEYTLTGNQQAVFPPAYLSIDDLYAQEEAKYGKVQ